MAELTEHKEQTALLSWWDMYSATKNIDSRLLFAIPNGNKRSFAVGVMMRAEGLKKGVPDLFLSVPSGAYHGLYIEMKRKKGGVVSREQKEYHEILRNAGYRCEVCKGFEAAKNIILTYLS